MSFLIGIVGCGLFAPAIVAAVVIWLCRRFCQRDIAERFACAVALVSGFCVAYFLFATIPGRFAAIIPAQHWHFLPYLAVAGAVLGPLQLARGVTGWQRWLLHATLALFAGWLLVPDWKSLAAIRLWCVSASFAVVFVLSVGLGALAARMPGRLLPLFLSLVSFVAAAVFGLTGTMTFAQLAGAVGAAMLGCTLVSSSDRSGAIVRGAAMPFAVLLGGLMIVGLLHSYPSDPRASFVLVLLAPMSLWLCEIPPMCRMRRKWRLAARIVIAGLPLAAAVGLAVAAQPSW